MRLGLEHTRALLAALGDPHHGLRAIHVAGTNGKGSTTATLAALLRALGLRVGTYTSPHLVSFRERIVVDDVPVGADEVAAFVTEAGEQIEAAGATFFEATTALAFRHFARERVDVAVVETGLGGRLDATNVLAPLAAVVTTIGMDHTEYLGPTIADIAREKAGIFKHGVPAVIGEGDPAVVAELERHARAAGAAPVRALLHAGWPREVRVSARGTAFSLLDAGGVEQRYETPLVGRHQAANAALALLTLDVLGDVYALSPGRRRAALAEVRVPGRFERRGAYLLDVAHNPDGAAALARTLASVRPPRPVVALLAVLSDKDWRGMMTALAPQVDGFVLTLAPTAPEARRWNPEEAQAFAHAHGWTAAAVPDFDAAIAHAAGAPTILVTGSFHTVGDLVARLPPASRAG